jgi:signal transduction histidine kinase
MTAAAAASQISAERMLTIEPGDDRKETRTYRNLLRQLTEVRDAALVRRVFAVDRQGRVRADTSGALPVGTEMPELARDRFELTSVFEGKPAYSQIMFEGTDGTLYKTGYAPIFLDNQVAGAVGVEGNAEFFGPLRYLLRSYLVLVAIGLFVLGALALLIARGLSRPLDRLVASALRIGGGDLETAVPAERTHEIGILAMELEVMRNRLESRDRQLKMMLAGVAHEVRNPIGGIELFAGLLGEELQGGVANAVDAHDHLERIRGEVQYLKTIVENFLAFARERRLAKAQIQTEELLQSVAELAQPDAAKRGVKLQISQQPASLEGDPALLVAATTNLIKNAIQASSAGGVVEVGGHTVNGHYQIEVTDHGAGIPAELQPRVFEPFFTTREKGTGLGLALAQKIARAHSGEIDFRSTPGFTTFRLRLPLAGSPGEAGRG